MKKFLNEFKEFINRGNVMDLAVAVIIGGAFTSIVTALTTNIINPLISVVAGGAQMLFPAWLYLVPKSTSVHLSAPASTSLLLPSSYSCS